MRHLSIVILACLLAGGVFSEPDAEPEHRALETTNNVHLSQKDIIPFLYWSLNQQQMSNANRNRNQFVRGKKQPCDDIDEDLAESDEMMGDDNLGMNGNIQPLDEDDGADDEDDVESSIGIIEAYVDSKSGAIIISESAIQSILNGNYISLSDLDDEELEDDDDGLGKANKTVRRRRGKGKGKRGKRRGGKRRRGNRRRRPIRISTRPGRRPVRYN